ncbi:MAG TPA: DUF559 domain-containing protein [Polyangiaceae bacterium]|nr:DUF559 domain-containing protein [Polyangiaceae bacterium]
MRSFTAPFNQHRRQLQLQQYAWRNQHAPTESEARLWEALRRRKLGVQFRRQVPVGGRYIVDFLAPVARLVVEVDGGCHSARRRADERRDRNLARLGYRVLRLPADLVMRQPAEAVRLVAEALGDRASVASAVRRRP